MRVFIRNVASHFYLVAAVGMVIYHFTLPVYQLEGSSGFKETHLLFALVLVFMDVFRHTEKKKLKLFMLALLLLSVVSIVYLKIEGPDIERYRAGIPTILDLVMGCIIVVVVLEACRRAWGPILPILAVISILYMLFGSYLPGFFRSHPVDFNMTISFLSISHMGTGIFGMLLGISSRYLFLFMLLGGLVVGSGASVFFQQAARLITRKMAGGTAMVAVASSGLVGSIVGAPAANVGITGVFTIPAMKKEGLSPAKSAAIEACASTGGGLVPPVLASTAFLMMGLTGIAYADICKMTVVPGVLYFIALGFGTWLAMRKLRLSLGTAKTEAQEVQKVNYKEVALRAPSFFVPLATLSTLIIMKYSIMYAAFWAIVSLLVVCLVMRPVRPRWKDFLDGAISGAKNGAKLGVALACVGIIVVMVTSTGMGVKLPMMIGDISGGILLIGVLLVAVTVIILGWGIPGNAAYVVTAIVAAPALVNMGISVAQAHEFIFIFALGSAITPPVAMAAMVAAGIAGASYMKAAIEAVKFGFAIFLLAFLVVWVPELMLLGTSVTWTLIILAATLAGIFLACLVWRGVFITDLGWPIRIAAALGAVSLFAFTINRNYLILAVGCVLLIAVIFQQIVERRKERQREMGSTGLVT